MQKQPHRAVEKTADNRYWQNQTRTDDAELAPYPMERHGFVHPDSWYDEYRRILELFDRTLQPAAR